MTDYARLLRNWREDRGILRFVDANFHVQLDPWQEKTLLLFASPRPEDRRIAMKACAGPGKSAVLSWCGWWFLGVQGDAVDHPKGAVTSITGDNLKDNLWAEFSKWQGQSVYLSNTFTWTSKRIFANDHPETWFLSARTWPKSASADEQGKTLSGIHSKYVLILIDESGAIPTTVLRAGEQAMSRASFGKMMQAGNPISLEGMLYAACTMLRHQWVVITVSGDPMDPEAWVNSPRVIADTPQGAETPAQWAQGQIDTYGRDNPWVKAYILSEFPPASINQMISLEEVEASMARVIRPEDYQWAQKRLGLDVARFGDDRTVGFPRQGQKAFNPFTMRNARTTDIAARAAEGRVRWAKKPGGDVLIMIDDTGHWGHGVIDQLTVSGHSVHPVVFHSKANHPRYKNRRVEMYLNMCEWIRSGGSLPKRPGLIAELTAQTYTYGTTGQFVMPEKDQIKITLGRSPDESDALAITFAMPEMPAEMLALQTERHHARTMDDTDRELRRRASAADLGQGRALTMDDTSDY